MLCATIAFLSYRDRAWIDAALDGVLAQTVPCQLLVSNDAGGDGAFERLRERLAGYHGPHRLDLLVEQPCNTGVVGHCNAVLPHASGDIVVMMAGDDVSAPDRVAKLLAAYEAHPETMAIGTDFVAVDADDQPVAIDFSTRLLHFDLRHLARSDRFHTLLGAALSFRREVFSRFGPMVGTVEDNALTLRACLLGDCRNLTEPLVRYRQHAGSVSHGVFARSGEGASELRRKRYARTAAFLQGTADDLANCLARMPDLPEATRRDAERLANMYAAAACMRGGLVEGGFAARWQALRRGLATPGMGRRSLEYVPKLWWRGG